MHMQYTKQTTNGPVNAHLRSAILPINIEYYGLLPNYIKYCIEMAICYFQLFQTSNYPVNTMKQSQAIENSIVGQV